MEDGKLKGPSMTDTEAPHRNSLESAILDVVETQIRDNRPPETKKTLERLIREGFEEEEAKRLIVGGVAAQIYDMLKWKKPFDHARYVETLNRLPDLLENT